MNMEWDNSDVVETDVADMFRGAMIDCSITCTLIKIRMFPVYIYADSLSVRRLLLYK